MYALRQFKHRKNEVLIYLDTNNLFSVWNFLLFSKCISRIDDHLQNRMVNFVSYSVHWLYSHHSEKYKQKAYSLILLLWANCRDWIAKLRQPTGQIFFPTFPKEFSQFSFKPKVAIAAIFWKMQRKTWYSILGVDAMPLSLKYLWLKWFEKRIKC